MPAHWLTPDEQRTWRAYLAATQRVYDALDADLQRDARIPHAYYVILAMLSEAPGRSMRMGDLAKATWSSRGRLSHAVDRLEAKGWVVRQTCETDRRGTFAELTDEGFRVLASVAPGHVDSVRRHVFNHLTPAQVKELGAIMATLAAES